MYKHHCLRFHTIKKLSDLTFVDGTEIGNLIDIVQWENNLNAVRDLTTHNAKILDIGSHFAIVYFYFLKSIETIRYDFTV